MSTKELEDMAYRIVFGSFSEAEYKRFMEEAGKIIKNAEVILAS